MFSKTSRYRKLSNTVTTDARGREIESKVLRLLPDVTGTFLHTVEEIDRFDHLAYKYYKKPGKWWRMCDANPDFMSPLALLGKEPIVSTRFPLTCTCNGSQPPWADLLKNLYEQVGVEDIQTVENITLSPMEQMQGDRRVIVYTEQYERAVLVTYNKMNIRIEDIKDVIRNAGFDVGKPQIIGRVGKNIIIPRNIA